MDVILLEEINGLGKRGATVKVADGYARNFLLPRRKAIEAVGNSQAVFRDRERARVALEQRQRQDAQSLRDRLMQASLQFSVQVGEAMLKNGSRRGVRGQRIALRRERDKNIAIDHPPNLALRASECEIP